MEKISQKKAVDCRKCQKRIKFRKKTTAWKCPSKWTSLFYCEKCGEKALEFDELRGLEKIERDERYPIRVTLQYYQSTDNGVVNEEIIKSIAALLKSSQKKADFVGSLVEDANIGRPTEWTKVEEKGDVSNEPPTSISPSTSTTTSTSSPTVSKEEDGKKVSGKKRGIDGCHDGEKDEKTKAENDPKRQTVE